MFRALKLLPTLLFLSVLLGCGQGDVGELTQQANAPGDSQGGGIKPLESGQQSTGSSGLSDQIRQGFTNPFASASAPNAPAENLGQGLANPFSAPVGSAESQPSAAGQAAMIDIQIGQQYTAGARVNFPAVGASFEIPADWYGALPQGSDSFMLGSTKVAGLVIALSHPAADPSQLVPEFSGPVTIAPSITMQVQGRPQVDAARITASVSVSDGIETLTGHMIAVFRPQGGGVVFVGFGSDSPQVYQRVTSQLAASFVPTEVKATQGATQPQGDVNQPAPQSGQALTSSSALAQEWDLFLRGKKASYRDTYSSNTAGGGGYSSIIDYYLCRDGRFFMEDSSSISSGGSSDFSFTEGGNLGSSNEGRWEIVTEGDLAGIKITFNNGEGGLARLDFEDGKTYINGDRYFITEDNPYC